MLKKILNLGILAHIDAGKTSLTERLLFDNDAIQHLGSVDAGSTTTDTNDLERERGITIRAAVAPFALGDLQVNLVDTPGHPDFIAEVERALSVLDGAILVLSAVEGVQAQTRVLMKSLKKMRLPTLLFINKIDRLGARSDELLQDIRKKLSASVIPLNSVRQAGTATAQVVPRSLEQQEFYTQTLETLADNDDALLSQVIEGRYPSSDDLQKLLIKQTGKGLVNPVFFGSALQGQGTRELADGVKTLLPHSRHSVRDNGELRGTVFAIERASSGEKIAYLRLFSGELRERQEITFKQREPSGALGEITGRVTGLEVVGEHLAREDIEMVQNRVQTNRGMLIAGGIAKIRGFPEIRVGAHLGEPDSTTVQQHFPPPSLAAVVRPLKKKDETRLHAALLSLSDEDPLIQTRPAGGGATSVLLYGEVQKEVIAERLKRDFGVEAVFSETLPVYLERPVGSGEALHEFDPHVASEFPIMIGLRVEPNVIGKGNSFTREVPWGLMPAGFYRAIEESALQSLQQGLYGWKVTDCAVYLTQLGYDRPLAVAAHFRNLTPMLLMRALHAAGTRVYEPCNILEVEVPGDVLGTVMGYLSTHEVDITKSEQLGPDYWLITGEIPARLVQEVTVALPGLTRGEGSLFSYSGSDRALRGDPPVSPRTDGNPLNYEEYMRFLSRGSTES
jgi:ribosomal protection tetracycline resistance protein